MKRLALVTCLILAPSLANAVDLTIDLTIPITTIEGKPKKECMELSDPTSESKQVCKAFRDMTAQNVIAEALSIQDRELHGDQVARYGAWAQQIAIAKSVVLTSEMITAIKTQTAKFFDPVTVAQVWEMVEPGSTKK